MFERLVSVRLGRFMERSGVLPPPSLLLGKVWVPVKHLFLRVPYTVMCIGEWAGAWFVQIDSSAEFDRVTHQGILYMLYTVGIGGYVLSILTQFLSN